jgi:hypothetical protein
MKLSISTISNPMTKLRKKLEPSAMEHRFRMPGMSSGLGSLRRTMPHLRPAIHLQYGGDPIDQLYASQRRNLYNPDPMGRQVLMALRNMAGRYQSPDFRAFPGSTYQLPYADGGPAPDDDDDLSSLIGSADSDLSEPDQEDKQLVIEAMLALEGRHPNPEEAIQRFVEVFGKGALKELQMLVAQQRGQDEDEEPSSGEEEEEPQPQSQSQPEDDEEEEEEQQAGGGLLRGPGSGQSDQIEGSTPSGRKVLLSDGEYVIDAPTVAALGDGSTSAGAARLDEFRKQIRQQAYGSAKQAKPMARGGRAITVEFGI